MPNSRIISANCRDCGRITKHDLLLSHDVERNDIDFPDKQEWQVLRCRGCETCGFRYVYHDYMDVYESPDGDQTHRREIDLYPAVIGNHKKLDNEWLLPKVIRKVHYQTLAAYGAKSHVLASIGLRATIEAVCVELRVTGSSLEKRIDKLFKEGHVSNVDKKRLHAIRFLGNDAAHAVVEPEEQDLRVALDIVENLLNSVFILAKRAKSLDTVIETSEEFLNLIESRVTLHRKALVLSLKNLLGTRYRLLGLQLDGLEQILRTEIAAGKFPRLTIAKEEEIEGHKVQLYAISELAKEADFDF